MPNYSNVMENSEVQTFYCDGGLSANVSALFNSVVAPNALQHNKAVIIGKHSLAREIATPASVTRHVHTAGPTAPLSVEVRQIASDSLEPCS